MCLAGKGTAGKLAGEKEWGVREERSSQGTRDQAAEGLVGCDEVVYFYSE